jgi:hypothetical protein
MSKKEFTEFISRQKPPVTKEEKPIDWAAQKEEWLKYLSDLYRMVESFLKEYTDSGKIALQYKNIELSEENIGRYTVQAMTLTFGTNRITLTPIGTLLIGTKGRVDMIGPKGPVRLILADKDSTGIRVTVRVLDANTPAVEEVTKPINWEWKVVVTNAPRMSYQKLTQETFFNAIMEVSNG